MESLSGIDGVYGEIILKNPTRKLVFDQESFRRAKKMLADNNVSRDMKIGVDWEYGESHTLISDTLCVVYRGKHLFFSGRYGFTDFVKWIDRIFF